MTGSGPSCNTWPISQSVNFRKYSIDKRIRALMQSSAQELMTSFGKMPNEVVMNTGIYGASCNIFSVTH